MRAYHDPMATDDLVTERAARAYRRILEDEDPGTVWVRLDGRELERLRRPVAAPLARNVDDVLANPDDMHAVA